MPVSKDRDGAFLAAPLALAIDITMVGAGLDAHAATVLAASDTVVRTVVRGIGVILPGEDFEAGLNRKAAFGGRTIAADASRISAASIFPELVCWDSINQAPVLSRRVRKEPGATTATTLPVCEGPVFDPPVAGRQRHEGNNQYQLMYPHITRKRTGTASICRNPRLNSCRACRPQSSCGRLLSYP